MNTIEKHFPWMTEADRPWLRAELLRRAAAGFEQAGLWHDAAECWADLDDHARAADCHRRGGDRRATAEELIDAGRHAEALNEYRQWEADLHEADAANRVRALLGQAACHYLGTHRGPTGNPCSVSAGQEVYGRALALIDITDGRDPVIAARCWSALGEHGTRLGRHDLVQTGYEQALAHLELASATGQKIDTTRSYLESIRPRADRALIRRLEELLAQWQPMEGPEPNPTPPTYEELIGCSEEVCPLRLLEGHGRIVRNVTFSPNGCLLASGSFDNTIRLWEVHTGRHLQTLQGHTDPVCGVAFSPNGQWLASGSHDGTVRLWDVATRRETFMLTGYADWVLSVAFSPDGLLLASGSGDGTVRLWDVENRRDQGILQGHNHGVTHLTFSPDGCLLAFSSLEGIVRFWNFKTRTQLRSLKTEANRMFGIAFSRNGELLASGSVDGTVSVWHVATASQLWKSPPVKARIQEVVWSPDGSVLLFCFPIKEDGLQMWHFESRRRICVRRQSGNSSNWGAALAISPDGRLLATCAENSPKVIQLWDISALGVGPKGGPAVGQSALDL